MKKYILFILVLFFINCLNDDEYNTPEVQPIICSEIELSETQNVIIQDFNNNNNNNWIQVIESSDRLWELDQQNANNFMSLSAFRKNNTPASLKTWLISPLFDFYFLNEKVFSFKLADAYQNGNPLHIYFSNDYNGKECPSNFTWTEITDDRISSLINNSTVYDNKFEWSGNISLEEFENKGVLAFVYESESVISTTIQLDDIVIGENRIKNEDQELVEMELPYTFLKGNLIQKDITGSLQWQIYSDNSVSISGYNTASKNTVYLVTPQFDFDKYENEILSFETQDKFDNGKVLDLYYSNDFDGNNYETATWNIINTNNQSDTDGVETNNYTKTNEINLSFIKGTAVIAFVYKSNSTNGENNPGPTTLLKIANIIIKSKEKFDVLFTEIADPKDNIRARFVEVYNNGNEIIDLLNWELRIYKNGNTVFDKIDLVGHIDPQSFYVIANNKIDYTLSYPDAPNASLFSNKITGNGDDVYELIYNDSRIDIYGEIGLDGTGEDWEYLDGKAIRLENIKSSNEKWLLNEWTFIIPAFILDMSPGKFESKNPIVDVSIEGDTKVNNTLNANASNSSNTDVDPLSFTYKWFISNNEDGSNSRLINGEASSEYNIKAIDENKFIAVSIIANDGEMVYSEFVGPIITDKILTEGIFISEIADPNNNTAARFIELYNSNYFSISLNGWKLKRFTNANSTETTSATITLSGTIDANEVFVIANNVIEFEKIFNLKPHQDGKGKGAVNSNGDDQLLLEASDGTLVDVFGIIKEDGSGTNHEFEDGRANRKQSIIKGNINYNFLEWDIWNDTGNEGTINEPQNAPEDFTPGVR